MEQLKRITFEYDGCATSAVCSLFVHQYSQAWFDLRGKRDSTPIL